MSIDMNKLTPTKWFEIVTNDMASAIAAISVSVIIKFRAEVMV